MGKTHTTNNDYSAYYAEFAEICKKYGLTKGEGTFELFLTYNALIGGISKGIQEYEQKMKLAQLLRMLNKNKGISFTNGFDEIRFEPGYILEELKAFLNTLLSRLNYYDRYKELGISPKTRIRNDIVHFDGDGERYDEWGLFKKFTPHKWNFTEPYSEDELSSIIEFEKYNIKRTKIREGRKPYSAPQKGLMALFLKDVIEKFNLVEDVKLFIWDLLVSLGYAESYGELMADNEKRQMISNWIKAWMRADETLRSDEFKKPLIKATASDVKEPVVKEPVAVIDEDVLAQYDSVDSIVEKQTQKLRMSYEKIMGR